MARNLIPKSLTLNQFLANKNLASDLKLPWVHSSSAANLFKIASEGKLMMMPCNVSKGEDLVYFFVGRPAYKVPSIEHPSEWQLPIVFVVRFEKTPPIKRVFPFDTGAFRSGRLPAYISMFNLDGYEISGKPELAGRLVGQHYLSEIERKYRAGWQPAYRCARLLGAIASTISREVSRNQGAWKYRAANADERAWRQALRPKSCVLSFNGSLRMVVAEKLNDNWSPLGARNRVQPVRGDQ